MFIRMLKLPEARARDGTTCRQLRVAIHAAAPCPIPVKEQMIAWWGPMIVRVLRRHRGQRLLRHHRRGVARAQGLGRPRHARHDPHPRRRVSASCRSASRARSTSRAAPASSTTRTPAKTAASRSPQGWSTHRRHRLRRRRGLPLPDRPQGHMIISRRRQHLSAGVREPAGDAPEGRRLRGLRRAQRGLRRGGEGGRAAGRHGGGRAGAGARS